MRKFVKLLTLTTLSCLLIAICGACDCTNGCGHNHSYTTKETTNPTCTEKGSIEYECECGDSYSEEIPALGHDYSQCSSNGNGTHFMVCSRDNAHTKTEDCSGGQATCQEKAKCKYCNSEYGNIADHSYDIIKYNETEHWYECSCGKVGETAAHSGGEATCKQKALCEKCGVPYGELLGHNYVNKKCSMCGDEIKTSEGLNFVLINNKTEYELSGLGTCKDEVIVVPSVYNNKPVTRIGYRAFAEYSEKVITRIYLPESLTEIRAEAFSTCNSSVFNVEDEMFYVPSIDNEYYALIGSEFEKNSFNINDNTKIIASYAISTNESVSELEIPLSVEYISSNAFDASIWKFMASTDFISYAPKTVSEIVITAGEHIANWALTNRESLINVQIAKTVKTIGDNAFYGSSLKNIEIPNSVIEIGKEAFRCPGITRLTFEENSQLKIIGESAFAGLRELYSVKIPKSVEVIGDSAFKNCSELSSVIFESGSQLKYAGDYIFKDTNLRIDIYGRMIVPSEDNSNFLLSEDELPYRESFAIPEGVEVVARGALKDSYGHAKTVIIPSSVKFISGGLMDNFNKIQEIRVDENNECYTSIDGNLYSKDGKTFVYYAGGKQDSTFVIPTSVTKISSCAFYIIGSLTTIEIPNGITFIEDNSFDSCNLLSNIIYSGTVQEWNNINKSNWISYVPATYVQCTDGKVNIN